MSSPAPLDIGGSRFEWGARTYVMGVLNITPDSFSGDGVLASEASGVDAALQLARRMLDDGADILDVGGESTRPGFQPVPPDEEIGRVVPVIEGLAREFPCPVSIDTTKAGVARAALAAGARIVNDVDGLRGDPEIAAVAAEHEAVLVIVHNQRNRPLRDVIGDVRAGFRASLDIAAAAGIEPHRVLLDPGFGFGWEPAQNLEMLRRLGELQDLERPLLVGTSRKSTIGRVLDLPVEERLEGTAATVAIAIANGADVVRVHDVKEMVRVARMSDAIVRGWEPSGEPNA